MNPCRVLFICTGNSARSILSEATLRQLGRGRFEAFSAGSQPTGRVNPHALKQLASAGMDGHGLSSKSWDEFVGNAGPALDLVITVCDSAAREPCPVLFGDFVRAHWGLADPAATTGDPQAIADAFQRAHCVIMRRVVALVDLPVETMTAQALKSAIDAIGAMHEDDPRRPA